MNSQPNEWGRIFERQQEISLQRDLQEAQRMAQEREAFKHSLNYQSQLKQMQRMQENQLRQQELQDMQQRAFLAARDEKRQRQRELEFKRELGKEYGQHQEFLRQQKLAEVQQRKAEEQRRMEDLRRSEEEERRRQLEFKRKLNEEQQQIKQFQEQQESIRRNEQAMQKRYEAELIEINRRKEEEKERNHRAYFHKLNEHQQRQAQLYTHATAPTNERALNIANWVDRNFYRQQAALAEKEERERQMRDANKRSLSEALQAQVKENDRKRYHERMQKFNEITEVNKRLEFSKRMEEQKHAARHMQMHQYKSELENQMSFNQASRAPAGQLSDLERRFNRQLLDSNAIQAGGSQIARNPDSHKAFMADAQKFYEAPARGYTPNQVDYSFEKVSRTVPLEFAGRVRPAGRPNNLSLFY